jgi:hypothetical protein
MSNSNSDDQAKKVFANWFNRNADESGYAVFGVNKQNNKVLQTEKTKISRRKYQIYCNKQHLLYLTRDELYRTVIKGHIITTLRIHEFTTFGFDRKTNIGEKNE